MSLDSTSLAHLRRIYENRPIAWETLPQEPLVEFRRWLELALAVEAYEPNAMVIATANREGRPSARIVLLKGLDERGLIFFTNRESRKGQELKENPFASVVFYWPSLQRQVCLRGAVEPLEEELAHAYFRSRPREHQLASWASRQSTPIPMDRSFLETRLQEVAERFRNQEVPPPPYWGGYRVIPDTVEFWQGRPNRLHDRFRYTRLPSGNWQLERLAP
ncbi:pyridoxamine 5'-phosphate oxidase [Candidatus Methylacidithermus pantelleriae]|uniref:Pyridoxamine 5'-phosphate oxidase n=1 Tax=Candidatus Methylacidithermus pantelleriae TaxID=2744239 RepID=A0A8J2BII3_9BACT|nr:pyridoxamine 5'-phosphate oxidase [Candidatus Methylacidithermus pantelleriae]CAF0697775.1 Pyridoxine/pyridoxamine 5\\'-phosphate oxidase [Candidatus Methylacidithermus pantelleriae]